MSDMCNSYHRRTVSYLAVMKRPGYQGLSRHDSDTRAIDREVERRAHESFAHAARSCMPTC